jgi:hypothetical protein
MLVYVKIWQAGVRKELAGLSMKGADRLVYVKIWQAGLCKDLAGWSM